MNQKATIDEELAVQPQVESPEPRVRTVALPKVVERWLGNNASVIAVGIVAAGFGIRLWLAGRSYLNPDEALHYYLINQPSVWLAYKASLTNAHPPLLFLILYFWHFVGRSELLLRLPSVMAGTAFCWLTFKWMGVFFGRAAAFIGLILVTFSPAMITLSGEVREYALLLCCMATALYFLGSAFQEKSARKMWWFTAFLYLAILSHYSAAFFALGVGVYAVVRIADGAQPGRVIRAWMLGQLGALAIYAFLYWSHVTRVKSVIPLWAAPLDRFYFRMDYGGFADLFDFLRENTAAIFQYTFGEAHVALALLWLFAGGTAYLFVRGLLPPRGTPRSFHLVVLVAVPFLAIWGAALGGIYPYVGSRHTVFLAPFSVAAVSFLLAAIAGNRLWASLLIAGALMGFANLSGKQFAANFLQENQREWMTAAVAEIHQSVAKSEVILVDYQSSGAAAYYLCGSRPIVRMSISPSGFSQFECGGYAIVSLDYHFWRLTPKNFLLNSPKMAQDSGLKAGQRFWVFQAGWGNTLDNELREHQPEFRRLTSKDFGSGIAVIPFILDANLLPTAPRQSCESKGSL